MTASLADQPAALSLADLRAGLDTRRADLGRRLAAAREGAGLSQPQLGRTTGMSRNTISKIEHGHRGAKRAFWEQADEACNAAGTLIRAHEDVARAALHCRERKAVDRAEQARTRLDALAAGPTSPRVLGSVTGPSWTSVTGDLGEELLSVMRRVARKYPRREAVRLVASVMAVVGLDLDEIDRVAQAVDLPTRVDARVIDNLGRILGDSQRLDDALGPAEVLYSVVAQRAIVQGLLDECPTDLRPRLLSLDSSMAASVGNYLMDMGHIGHAAEYFGKARIAAHHARNPARASHAACSRTYAAYLQDDACTALDMSAVARSLAARSGDPRLIALADQMAAGAYAVDGQAAACQAACDRAEEALSREPCGASPAYFVHRGMLASQRTACFLRLGMPRESLAAACEARDHFDRRFVGSFARSEGRYAAALLASHELDEAARVLGEAAMLAARCPSVRLTDELHAVRTSMQPHAGSRAVHELDAQLRACRL